MMTRTAIAYDPFHLRHTMAGHPENHKRLENVWTLLQIDDILTRLQQVQSTPAPPDAILRVHTREYIERLEELALRGGGMLDSDTYVTSDSYQAALLAAGGLLAVVDSVLEDRADNGFALVRPPGHHARPHCGMGFCLLANVAIAARWAQDRYGVERVLIIDFDVHHGNGTQEVFYTDPNVMLVSVHQYPHYPGTGAAHETGADGAVGSTINIPMPAHVGDAGYLESFRRVLAPAARDFQPDLVLLSAGYDAHWRDPLSTMYLSVAGYVELLDVVMEVADELCGGRLVCALEGGYDLEALAHNVLNALRRLSGDSRAISDPFGLVGARERDVTKLLDHLRSLHRIVDPPHYSTA